MPWPAKKRLRQVPVFCGDAQPPAVARAETGGDVVEVLHRPDVDPELRHRDDHVGAAEAERRREARSSRRESATVSRTRSSPVMPRWTCRRRARGRSRSRRETPPRPLHAREPAPILCGRRASRQDSRRREQRLRLLLEPALRRQREDRARRCSWLPRRRKIEAHREADRRHRPFRAEHLHQRS